MLKRRDSSMEPYRTSVIVCIHGLKTDSSFILWYWFERQLLLSLRLSRSAKPQACWLAIIKSWGRQSDPLERSISIVATRHGKTRVTSYELRVMSYELRVESLKARVEIQNCEFKSTSYEFKPPSYEFESTSYEFESTSFESESTSYVLESTRYESESTSYEF